MKFVLPPEQGGNWWGWLPLAILGWAATIVFICIPTSPEGLHSDAKLVGIIIGSLVSFCVSYMTWLDIYRNPKKIYISDEGIGWDSFKKSFFVKWEDVTNVRREWGWPYDMKIKFRFHPKRIYVWNFFENYDDLKSEIKRRAINAKITIK